MNVMVIGGGGREHAMAWCLTKSPRVREIICVPGNAGTMGIATNVDADISDHAALIELVEKHNVSLTIVGPEVPLCAGIVDDFHKAGLRIVGPTAAAARIEGDKAYAKKIMKAAHIPTAEARVFDRVEDAKLYVEAREHGFVVKASGLAAGKGVFVCENNEQGLQAVEQIMVDRAFGKAGDKIIVEELLKGQELSVFALVEGRTIYMLATAQDHKAIGDGDVGPNTGGMGAYSPAPIATPSIMATVERDILVPLVDAMNNDGSPYRGILYAGLMLTPGGPKVLEFNCRLGDPEAQAVLMRLESDILDIFEALADGDISKLGIRWNPQPAVCVVMTAQGYPGPYEQGQTIEGLDSVAELAHVQVFQAGTKQIEQYTVTSGGRVLGVTAMGPDIRVAKSRAYQAVEKIHFNGAYYRRDIADKAIAAKSTS